MDIHIQPSSPHHSVADRFFTLIDLRPSSSPVSWVKHTTQTNTPTYLLQPLLWPSSPKGVMDIHIQPSSPHHSVADRFFTLVDLRPSSSQVSWVKHTTQANTPTYLLQPLLWPSSPNWSDGYPYPTFRSTPLQFWLIFYIEDRFWRRAVVNDQSYRIAE
ncbi:hypothetical protein AVEN_86635-1 [Araneus ventricosus]|uniref:Uncharacterized protein n=1 Tax=Araneus ventricosus TaxID=182803 RepID=A0A4Y2GT18_ARAVE|nr:hypothetical protein AVEN_86635-1 [Araneus ventricosus]